MPARIGLGMAGIPGNGGQQLRLLRSWPARLELIKSNLTYKRLKQVVPLDVNYYTQGTVLETELFGSAPLQG